MTASCPAKTVLACTFNNPRTPTPSVASAAAPEVKKPLTFLQKCLELGKFRLSSTMAFATTLAYWSGPIAFPQFLAMYGGTLLVAASGSAFNQVLERDLDKQMQRTKNRPVASGQMEVRTAVAVAVPSLFTGLAVLGFTFHPFIAALQLVNCLVYVAVYTPMKRLTIWNTWVGSIVGGLSVAAGNLASPSSQFLPAWNAYGDGVISLPQLLAFIPESTMLWFAVLYFWQICHFMPIQQLLRNDYLKDFKMLSQTDRSGRAALAWIFISSALLVVVTYQTFTSLAPTWVAASMALLMLLFQTPYVFLKPPKALVHYSLAHIIGLCVVVAIVLSELYRQQQQSDCNTQLAATRLPK